MKKIIIGLIAGFGLAIAAVAISKEKMEMRTFDTPCMTVEQLVKVIDDYKEVPLLRGDSVRKDGEEYNGYVAVLYMNPETKSWTMFEKIDEQTYCIIAVGGGLAPVDKKNQKDRKSNKM